MTKYEDDSDVRVEMTYVTGENHSGFSAALVAGVQRPLAAVIEIARGGIHWK